MLEPGDVVKIKPEYLDVKEDPDFLYLVVGVSDSRVKIFYKTENSALGGIETVSDYMLEKVSHVDISK